MYLVCFCLILEDGDVKMRRLFGDNIEPACVYCRNGTRTKKGDKIMCPKNGMVDIYYSCRRFCYDPLRRTPSDSAALPEFPKSDFEL